MTGEIHLFVLWSEARGAEERILDDATARFRVLDVVEVEWSREEFTRSLTRFYGTALPPDSDKERHSGTGPFLVVVVQDARPRRRPRRTGRGWALVNANVFDARARYREWTGGGYRVHASESPAEAARDLFLLFGRPSESWLEQTWAGGGYPSVRADPVGTDGWEDEAQLLGALRTVVAVEKLPPTEGADLALAVDDVWWAEWIAGGRELDDGARELLVAGEPFRLALTDLSAAGSGTRRAPGARP